MEEEKRIKDMLDMEYRYYKQTKEDMEKSGSQIPNYIKMYYDFFKKLKEYVEKLERNQK